jgi:DNA-binding transcriptional regulator YiaG
VTIDEATKIRVIRAILGLNVAAFANIMGTTPTSVWQWENGHASPQLRRRETLHKICKEHGIAISPSGYPFPVSDCVVFQGEKRERPL